MSYINEALKKAQKERNTRQAPYIRTFSGNLRRVPINKAKWLLYFLLPLLVILGFLSLLPRMDVSTTGKAAEEGNNLPVQITQDGGERQLKALYEKAGSLFKNGQYGAAKKVYEKMLDLDPGCVDALNNIGIIDLRDRNYLSAERHLEKAIRLKPVFTEPYYNLACLNAIKGDRKRGISYLQRAVSLNHEVKHWASNDRDLANLKDLPAFQEIIEE
jgi:tetratricopeptide (TPR) repeat protein